MSTLSASPSGQEDPPSPRHTNTTTTTVRRCRWILVLVVLVVWTVEEPLRLDWTRLHQYVTGSRSQSKHRNATSTITTTKDYVTLLQEELDWDRGGTCGVEKCYFATRNDASIGYIIHKNQNSINPTTNCRRCDHRFELASRTYQFAQNLSRAFGIRHTSLDPPFQLVASEEDDDINDLLELLAERLSSHASHENAKKDREMNDKNTSSRFGVFDPNRPLVVANVRALPLWESVWIRKNPLPSSTLTTRSDLERFATTSPNNVTSFLTRFANELTTTFHVIRHEKCLIHDFQFIVDPTGRIQYLDLDRCFTVTKRGRILKKSPPNRHDQRKLSSRLHKFQQYTKELLQAEHDKNKDKDKHHTNKHHTNKHHHHHHYNHNNNHHIKHHHSNHHHNNHHYH